MLHISITLHDVILLNLSLFESKNKDKEDSSSCFCSCSCSCVAHTDDDDDAEDDDSSASAYVSDVSSMCMDADTDRHVGFGSSLLRGEPDDEE